LRRESEDINTGRRIDEFRRAARGYIHEFQRQQFCRPVVPLLSVTRERHDEEAVAVCGSDSQICRQPSPPASPLSEAPKLGTPPHQLSPLCSEQLTPERLVIEDFDVRVDGLVPRPTLRQLDACECGGVLQLHSQLSLHVCRSCGSTRPYLDATVASAFADDAGQDFGSLSSKRVNHFTDWLASIQAKESFEIHPEKLELIMEQLLADRCSEEDITIHRVKDALKKLRLRKYYEHVQLITSKITNRPAPQMTPEMEERLKVYFLAASASFQRNCPPTRRNLISYSLVLYKLCELLGFLEFLPCFTMVKGRDKLARMEVIWRRICDDLDWEFIPFPPN
jgi:hypothetical protein